MLIIGGDVFDRGNESQEMRKFLTETKNKICVIGNHEILMLDAINYGHFRGHDISNGTIDAAIQLTGGYQMYPEIHAGWKAKDFFKKDDYDIVNHEDVQERIIKNLIKTDIVEWIVDNFYIDTPTSERRVTWDKGRKKFSIKGKPRYYLQIEDRLVLHGFFPSPDWVASYPTKVTLPSDYDLLEESSELNWEEYGCGIWANTPFWLKLFYKYKLVGLMAYIVKRGIKHIYLGHWAKSELENMVISLSMSPAYIEYNDKMPVVHFTDGTVKVTGNVIVETFST